MTAVLSRELSNTGTIRPAPRREPPFDDELDVRSIVGPLDRPLPFDEWRPHRRPLSRLPTPRRTLPDPAVWGRRLLLGIVETAGGRRPLHQLAALLSPGVARGIGAEFERAARRGAPHWTGGATIRTVRVSEPTDTVAELSATLQAGERVHAVAMRIEQRKGRWCCTRLVLG